MNKRSIILCLLVLALFSCNNNKTNKTTSDRDNHRDEKEDELFQKGKPSSTINYLISGKSAGSFKIGAPIPPSSSGSFTIRKETHTETAEGETYEKTIYIISQKEEDLLHLLPGYDYDTGNYTDKIGEIIILSARFITNKGMGVGSTIEKFINVYPEYKLWYTYVSGMYIIETEEVQAQFILSEEDFTGNLNITGDMTILKNSDFRQNAKVLKIRII